MGLSQIPNTRGQISSAIDVLTIEYTQITEEIQAFEQFREKVSNTSTNIESKNSINNFRCQQKSTVEGTSKVRTAYRDTIMSVPHYEKEYGDTYLSSVSEELGPDLAIAITESSELTPISKSALINQIDNTIEGRKQLRKTVQSEQDSIESGYNDLYNIGEFIHQYPENKIFRLNNDQKTKFEAKLSNNIDDLDKISINRQQEINKIQKSAQTNQSHSDLYSYFYQSMSTNYPVLETIGKLGREIKKLERDICEKS